MASRVKRVIRFEDLQDAMIPTDEQIERRLLPRTAIRFRKNMRRLFKTEGESGGPAWAPLSSGYEAIKRRTHPRKTILRRDDELYKSLTSPGHPKHVALFINGSIFLGTSDENARRHADGAGHLPVRNPVQHTTEQIREYDDDVEKFLRPFFRRQVKVLQRTAWARARAV